MTVQYRPMLAAPMKKGTIVDWSDWAIEEKYDGHRLVVYVGVDKRQPLGQTVSAYARPRGGDGRMIERTLPDHLVAAFNRLPWGVYDGELMGGDTSTDVSRLDLKATLRFVVFDLLELHGSTTIHQTYEDRHLTLHRIFASVKFPGLAAGLSLATPHFPVSEKDVTRFVKAVWAAGGEGAILKRKLAPYHVGKRTPDWIKIKRVEHAALTLVGFEPSRGTVRFPGHPFAIAKLRDDDGNETTCKIKNDEELKRLEDAWLKFVHRMPHDATEATSHPWVNKRKLVIEFQQRTRDGGYRGPVLWDRWENE